MKQKKQITLVLLFISITIGCSKMNDKHDIYLQGGEIIYLGRVDSARILPGKNRFLLRYWITDLRANELKIYWNQMMDSTIIPIPSHKPTDSIDVMIGDKDNRITEGSYTFQMISTDDYGLESIVFEKIGNVYGDQFSLLMTDRFVRDVSYNWDTQEIIVEWGEPSSSREIGVELTYFIEDIQNVIKFTTEDLVSKTAINNINIEKGITYRTMFLPEPMAIDTFFTNPVRLPILQNAALNIDTRVISNLNDNYSDLNAIDGIVSTTSRWSSTSDTGQEH